MPFSLLRDAISKVKILHNYLARSLKFSLRTQNIRLDFLARRLLESVFLFWLVIAFVQQWIMPHLQETEERKHKSQVNLLLTLNADSSVMSSGSTVELFGTFFRNQRIKLSILPFSWKNILLALG